MKIIVNRKPVAELPAHVFKYLAKGTPSDRVSGKVMSADEASAKFTQSSQFLIRFLGALVGALVIGVTIWTMNNGAKSDQGLVLAFGVPGLLIFGVAMTALYRRRIKLWTEDLPERIAALPPAGTAIELTADGVLIGSQMTLWSQLQMGELELTVDSGEDPTIAVERAGLVGEGGTISLDAGLIENGRPMIEAACQRLLNRQ